MRPRSGAQATSARGMLRAVGLLGLLLLGALAGAQEAPNPTAERAYVDDARCGTCHADLAASYRHVGMARSFGPPSAMESIETWSTEPGDPAGRFFHEPSGRWYEMRRDGDRRFFRRWQVDAEGREIHAIEEEVDWILGSGHTSRTYLVHLPGGELFQLPVSWYSQGEGWAMAPGFDGPQHAGMERRVRRECMFCHNAYPPDVDSLEAGYGDEHTFPFELPHGTGCQRCHGPGGDHVDAAVVGVLPGEIRDTIVNPASLAPRLRDDVCRQCHLQPAVAMLPLRVFGTEDYDAVPGRPLKDFIVHFDVDEEDTARHQRFEINHHPYRLEQSACWTESRGALDGAAAGEVSTEGLSCLSCHDPHRKPAPAAFAAQVRRACLGCHQLSQCDAQPVDPEGGDCAGCHMPKRRTRDVVHVVMTDHRIQTPPADPAALLAPLDETTPVITDLEFLYPDQAPAGDMADVYRVVGALRAGGGGDMVDHLARRLAVAAPAAVDPWLDLARGRLKQQDQSAARAALEHAAYLAPDHPQVDEWQALLAVQQGDYERAVEILRAALTRRELPELRFNLGRVLVGTGHTEAGLAELRRAAELRPLMSSAWYQIGVAEKRLGRDAAAAVALRRALSVDPTDSRTLLHLADVLARSGQATEALRYLRHGLSWADDRAAVEDFLGQVRGRAAEGP